MLADGSRLRELETLREERFALMAQLPTLPDDLTFAQFVLLTPFPGTVDFEKWAAEERRRGTSVAGVAIRGIFRRRGGRSLAKRSTNLLRTCRLSRGNVYLRSGTDTPSANLPTVS